MKKWISIVLFNIYLECIMQDSLQGHHTSMSEGGQSVTCTDNIDLTAGSNSKLQKLLDERTAFTNTCSVEISTEKSKVTEHHQMGQCEMVAARASKRKFANLKECTGYLLGNLLRVVQDRTRRFPLLAPPPLQCNPQVVLAGLLDRWVGLL